MLCRNRADRSGSGQRNYMYIPINYIWTTTSGDTYFTPHPAIDVDDAISTASSRDTDSSNLHDVLFDMLSTYNLARHSAGIVKGLIHISSLLTEEQLKIENTAGNRKQYSLNSIIHSQ